MLARLGKHAPWLVPVLICLFVFWPGLVAWFQRDDFAWLGLRLEVYTGADLWKALFSPKAQGTIRPWSERGFFMLYSKLFGLDALAYRITVFATQILAVYLLSQVAWRLTSSRLASFLAPLFWCVNASLGTALAWTSAYNQVMCAAFLLGAFLLWLRFAETGSPGAYAAQFAVFLLGFGALEINIVYPGVVLAWCVLARQWRRMTAALPMAGVSAAYFLYHNSVAPKVKSGPYALHWDASIAYTLKRYWIEAFGGRGLAFMELPSWFIAYGAAAPWIITMAMAAFLLWAIWRRRWLVLFGFVWFLATLAPVLPLRDHISEYYLTIPTIGLALAGAEAVVKAWAWRQSAGAAALVFAVALYAIPAALVGRSTASYYRDRSVEAERLVFGVQRARELHPKKAILLTDVSDELFWSCINDKPFRLLSLENIYLAPGAETAIQENADLGDLKSYVFPEGQVLQLLDAGQGVVYSAAGDKLRNVTKIYLALGRTRWKPALAQRIEVGNPLFAGQLREGWYRIEDGIRWMGRVAAAEVQGPSKSGQRLTLQGYLAKEILINGPLKLDVRVDEFSLPSVILDQPDSEFIKNLPLPDAIVARPRVRVVLELDKAVVPPGEDRELGLLFGSITIH